MKKRIDDIKYLMKRAIANMQNQAKEARGEMKFDISPEIGRIPIDSPILKDGKLTKTIFLSNFESNVQFIAPHSPPLHSDPETSVS